MVAILKYSTFTITNVPCLTHYWYNLEQQSAIRCHPTIVLHNKMEPYCQNGHFDMKYKDNRPTMQCRRILIPCLM